MLARGAPSLPSAAIGSVHLGSTRPSKSLWESSAQSLELGRQRPKRNRLDALAEGIPIVAGVHNQAPGRFEIVAGEVKPLLEPGSEPTFDLNRPAPPLWQVEDEIHLSTRGSTIEACRRSIRRRGQQVLDNAALPAGADHGMPGEFSS